MEQLIQQILDGITQQAGLGGWAAVVGGIGVANIMYAVVKERTKEIGVKMALGARSRWITGPLILEGLTYTLIGGILGMIMAMGAVMTMTGRTKGTDLGGLYKTMPITATLCIIGAAAISVVAAPLAVIWLLIGLWLGRRWGIGGRGFQRCKALPTVRQLRFDCCQLFRLDELGLCLL